MSPDYDFPADWHSYTNEQKQAFFAEFRERLYWYWFQRAKYQKRRAERVDSFRVDGPLE